MAKLTQTQRRDLCAALVKLDRAIDFIMADNVAVCRRIDPSRATPLDFSRGQVPEILLSSDQKARGPHALSEICKDIGSDLCALVDARKIIAGFVS